jgi:hypothetical protein
MGYGQKAGSPGYGMIIFSAFRHKLDLKIHNGGG